jgi:heat shock protein HslJ
MLAASNYREFPQRANFVLLAVFAVATPLMGLKPFDVFPLTNESLQNEPKQSVTDLGGTSWQLVKSQSSNDTTLTPDDKAKYTITFGTDGRVRARLDCNRGSGKWKSDGPNQLQLGPMALTRAMCPPGSLHDRIARDWPAVRSYVIKDGHLFLSLLADGGIYEYEPLGSSQAEASSEASVKGDD